LQALSSDFSPEVADGCFHNPPAWASSVVWYQLFVERFRNGDPTNDPTAATMHDERMGTVAPVGWCVTPWTQAWERPDSWMQGAGDFQPLLQYRRYGGDLQGVLDKLDYLQELGVTAVYFNPLNDAPSLHKFDARHYHHIDIHFGPDPEGDLKIIASEDPGDPSTWKWTSADRLFLRVVDEMHRRGMKVIVDFSWNHTGTLFWAWQDILANQSQSRFRDWYNIARFDDPSTPENEFEYEGWMGVKYMPELKKTDITTHRQPGRPYEGDIHPGPKQHIFEVTQRWLAPDGDIAKGIDGFRLDVADHIGLKFWRDWRRQVRSIKADAYLVGEIWWEQWPDRLMDPKPYVEGDIFDAVMFYQVYRPARYFFADTDHPMDARELKDSLEFHWKRLRPETVGAMMNVSSSHDAPRLLTDFFNTNRYKYHANTHENPAYRTGKPDVKAYARLKLYLMHLFTIPGAPQVWNGEEMGMWGADDPHCRKPLIWPDMKFEAEKRYAAPGDPVKRRNDKVSFDHTQFDLYKQLIALRKQHPVLSEGQFEFVLAQGKVLGYKRFNQQEQILVFFNLEEKTVDYQLPVGTYVNLLTGKLQQSKLQLKPESGVILKLKI
jgi:glycosidase